MTIRDFDGGEINVRADHGLVSITGDWAGLDFDPAEARKLASRLDQLCDEIEAKP